MKNFQSLMKVLALLMVVSSLSTAGIKEKSASKIEKDANASIAQFYKEVKGSQSYLSKVKGYVVFSDVIEGGMFIGGKYGEGVLRMGDTSKGYYSIMSASAGFIAGGAKYDLIIAFTTDEALHKFMHDDDWESEIDVNMAMAEWNSEEELDDIDFGRGMVGFVFNSKGLMGNFTLEGTRFKKIYP